MNDVGIVIMQRFRHFTLLTICKCKCTRSFTFRNINIEARDNEDYTPLLCAVCYPCTEIVKLLLQEGALSDITEQNEKNVLHLAVEWKQKDVLKVQFLNCKQNKSFFLV